MNNAAIHYILTTWLLTTWLLGGLCMEYYGRTEELNILDEKYQSNRFEFGYLYGQRRIGKTSLIEMFRSNHKSIVLFASDSDDVKTLESLSYQFNEQRTDSLNFGSYSSWDSFFEAIGDYFGNDKGFLVIDEYPNIVLTRDGKRKKTDFVSKLQKAIDYKYKHQCFMLLLTGSNVSFMEKEIKDSGAPLYQRHTFQLQLYKFEWNDALVPLKNINNYEKAKILALTNTYPLYLSLIDDKLDFSDNLNNIFYNRAAAFIDDPSKLFTSAIVESGFYASILDSISNDINTISDIASRLKTETGKVSKYMDELLEAKIVTKKTVFMSSRQTYYIINDPMLAFYYRFIRDNAEMIKLGYGKLIRSKQENAIEDFIHHYFENECIEYLSYLNKKGQLADLYYDFQNYKVENSPLGRSIEIDIVSSSKNALLVAECKLTKSKRTKKDYYDMLDDISVPLFSNYKKKELYLFGSNGFEDDLLAINDPNLKLIDLSKMFNE